MARHDLPPISDAEEARIQAGIAEDPDNPEWTEEDFRTAKPFAEVFPDLAASIARSARPKEAVSLPIDADVLAKLRASGEGWQARVNAVLRAYVERGAA